MSDRSFLEESVLRLTETVDKNHTEIRRDIADVKEKVVRFEGALEHHATQDTAAQNRVNSLQARVEKLEKPYKWLKWTASGVIVLGTLAAALSRIIRISF